MGEFDSGVSAASPPAVSSVSGDTSAASPAAPSESSQNFGAQPSTGQGTTASPATTDQPGPIPYERFREVNERMKAAEQSAQRWQQVQQQYGELADPATYRASMEFFSRFKQDPVAATTQLLTELGNRDEFRPAVASHAARVLQGLRHQMPREEAEPQPDLVAENGAPVYSATQQRSWLEWNQRRMQAQFDERLQTELKPLKAIQQEREVARVQHHAENVATQMYEKAKGWHGFKQHEAEIAKVFNEHRDWNLQDAYLHVLHTKILPALPAQAQAQVVADLQQKAAAQSLNPQQATPTKAPNFNGDFLKALEWAARQRR